MKIKNKKEFKTASRRRDLLVKKNTGAMGLTKAEARELKMLADAIMAYHESQLENKLAKPILKTIEYIDYGEAEDWIGKKLGYCLRDVEGQDKHYETWCRSHNERPNASSQKQWKRYLKASDGEKVCPPYCDYWHFLVDKTNPQRGGFIKIESWLLENCEEWQAKITQAFISEFGEGQMYLTDW